MLRDYQIKYRDEVLAAFEERRSIMLQMPTGTGKTHVFCDIISFWLERTGPNEKILVLAHRNELIEQTLVRLHDFRIYAGRIVAGKSGDYSQRVQVGSVMSLQSIARRPRNVALIIVDEAHHTPAQSYMNIIEYYPPYTKLLGVTATPMRNDGSGFRGIFEHLIVADSISDFIKQGYLSSIKHLASYNPELSKVRINKRDYDNRDLEELMSDNGILADLVKSYKKHALNKKCIVFAVSKSHSANICMRYNNEGISAANIDADTPADERIRILRSFEEGAIKVLCNVEIFSEGFDSPDVEVVQLARPTKSLILYLQQIGRVMRRAEDKEYGLILDNGSLWQEHGLVTRATNWTLGGATRSTNRRVMAISGGGRELVDPRENPELELVEVEVIESEVVKRKSGKVNQINENGETVFCLKLEDWPEMLTPVWPCESTKKLFAEYKGQNLQLKFGNYFIRIDHFGSEKNNSIQFKIYNELIEAKRTSLPHGHAMVEAMSDVLRIFRRQYQSKASHTRKKPTLWVQGNGIVLSNRSISSEILDRAIPIKSKRNKLKNGKGNSKNLRLVNGEVLWMMNCLTKVIRIANDQTSNRDKNGPT